MMDSAEGLCELVSVLCKLSDEMSLPLSAFFLLCFFAFLPCCFHPSAFPIPLSAYSFPPSAFLPFPSLALSSFLPHPQHRLAITRHQTKTHAHSGRQTSQIVQLHALARAAGGGRNNLKQLCFPCSPPRPRLVQVLRS